jgi:hypothetical protein
MSVAHRMQYFAFGGGGIGATAPGTWGAGTAYTPDGTSLGAVRRGGDGGVRRNPGGGAGGSTCPEGRGGSDAGVAPGCGRVKPHLAQKSAPSSPISPQ